MHGSCGRLVHRRCSTFSRVSCGTWRWLTCCGREFRVSSGSMSWFRPMQSTQMSPIVSAFVTFGAFTSMCLEVHVAAGVAALYWRASGLMHFLRSTVWWLLGDLGLSSECSTVRRRVLRRGQPTTRRRVTPARCAVV